MSIISFHTIVAPFNSYPVQWQHWLSAVIKSEMAEVGEICIIFCDDDYLCNINRKYLNNNNLTDVITFSYDKNTITGDIFISIDRVKGNAKKYRVTFQNELCRVMVHGLLHLMGYKDKSKSEKIWMRAMEDKYLLLLQKRFT